MLAKMQRFAHLGYILDVLSSLPTNGYVAENGITGYVAEDGVTAYVQET